MRSYPVKENPIDLADSEILRYKQTDGQTNRQTNKQTDKQTNRQTVFNQTDKHFLAIN